MLQSTSKIVYNYGNVPLQSYEHLLLNNGAKREQLYEDILGIKERSIPCMQQVIQSDMERMKTNKVYDRKLNRDLHGPKGLTWQCKQELQRLRSDERDIRRDLIRINRDLARVTSLPPLSRKFSILRVQNSRLSSIIEENNVTNSTEDIRKSTEGNTTSQTSVTRLPPIKRKSSSSINGEHESSSLKPMIRQIIAKTSDNRLHLQLHADRMEKQKRLIEQKLKQFLR